MSAKSKLLASIGTLFVLAIGLIAAIGYINFKNASTKDYTAKLGSQAILISKAIEQKASRYFDVLEGMSEVIPIADNGEIANDSQLLSELALITRQLGVLTAYVGLRDGKTFELMKKGMIPNFNAIEKKREWFSRAMAGDENIFTRPFLSSNGGMVASISVPVRRNGVIVAALGINLSLDAFTSFIEQLTDNNQIFVSRQDGFILAAKYPDYIGKDLFELRPSFTSYKGQAQSTHSYTHDNEEYFVNAVMLEQLNWQVWAWDNWEHISSASNSNLRITLSLSVVLIALALAFSYWLIVKLMYLPIGGEPEQINHLVGKVADGDLSSQHSATGKETGVFRSVLTMVDNLRAIVADIEGAAQAIGDKSDVISTSTASVTQSSEKQMHQLEQTATAMNQMVATVEEVAKNAVSASESASEASTNSNKGTQIVVNMNQSLQKLISGMQQVVEVVNELEKETLNIGGILEVIDGIAEQTNLLALNAAIEAARAGEHGRGFAVVADEVRNLANKTTQSTGEIQDMIGKLQADAKRSVEISSANMNDARQTEEKASETTDALEAIQVSVGIIQEMNTQIATAAEQQTQVTEEINSSVVEINDLAKSTHHNASNNHQQTDDLKQIADSLTKSITVFKL